MDKLLLFVLIVLMFKGTYWLAENKPFEEVKEVPQEVIYDVPYPVLHKMEYKVTCMTSAHINIAPPYLSAEGDNAYLVNVGGKETYYIKDADCSILGNHVGSDDNIDEGGFWRLNGAGTVKSKYFKCDYLADRMINCDF